MQALGQCYYVTDHVFTLCSPMTDAQKYYCSVSINVSVCTAWRNEADKIRIAHSLARLVKLPHRFYPELKDSEAQPLLRIAMLTELSKVAARPRYSWLCSCPQS